MQGCRNALPDVHTWLHTGQQSCSHHGQIGWQRPCRALVTQRRDRHAKRKFACNSSSSEGPNDVDMDQLSAQLAQEAARRQQELQARRGDTPALSSFDRAFQDELATRSSSTPQSDADEQRPAPAVISPFGPEVSVCGGAPAFRNPWVGNSLTLSLLAEHLPRGRDLCRSWRWRLQHK